MFEVDHQGNIMKASVNAESFLRFLSRKFQTSL